jgi:hypothetical protein
MNNIHFFLHDVNSITVESLPGKDITLDGTYNKINIKYLNFLQVCNLSNNPNKLKTFLEKDWILTNACLLCSTKYTFFNREHHCRFCNISVCNSCSNRYMQNLRICKDCYSNKEENDTICSIFKKKLREEIINSEAAPDNFEKNVEFILRFGRWMSKSKEFKKKIEMLKDDELPALFLKQNPQVGIDTFLLFNSNKKMCICEIKYNKEISGRIMCSPDIFSENNIEEEKMLTTDDICSNKITSSIIQKEYKINKDGQEKKVELKFNCKFQHAGKKKKKSIKRKKNKKKKYKKKKSKKKRKYRKKIKSVKRKSITKIKKNKLKFIQ